MKVIGFATKFYTLWEVSEPYEEYGYTKQKYSYIKNLSFDLEKAKSKIENGKFEVDLTLRGSKSFSVVVNDLTKEKDPTENQFPTGKYKCQDVDDVDDLDYSLWYYNYENKFSMLRNYLLNKGCGEIEGLGIFDYDDYKERLKNIKRNEYINSLETGHHLENKKRVELEIKEIEHYTFNGAFGLTHVITYASKCGKIFKYMGGSPKDISSDNFSKIKGTIKHDNYHGEDDTKLLRISKIK